VTIELQPSIDEAKLGAFMNRALDDLGATFGAALVVIGDKARLYKAMVGAGPLGSVELAERTGTAERYVREWLNAQAAAGCVNYDGTGATACHLEQALALANEDSPGFVPGLS
jgi:hypothetical protein